MSIGFLIGDRRQIANIMMGLVVAICAPLVVIKLPAKITRSERLRCSNDSLFRLAEQSIAEVLSTKTVTRYQVGAFKQLWNMHFLLALESYPPTRSADALWMDCQRQLRLTFPETHAQ